MKNLFGFFAAILAFSANLSALAATNDLSDLNSVTFSCPKAALNAAARAAASMPSQGSYQFIYFKIVVDSDHPKYDVRFKSNVWDEPELDYTVTLYCQQGFDPNDSAKVIRR